MVGDQEQGEPWEPALSPYAAPSNGASGGHAEVVNGGDAVSTTTVTVGSPQPQGTRRTCCRRKQQKRAAVTAAARTSAITAGSPRTRGILDDALRSKT